MLSIGAIFADLQSWWIFTITLFIIYVYKTHWKDDDNLPPMPCRPLPILGHATLFKPTVTKAMMRWKKEAGDVFRIYIGSTMHISLSSYKTLKEAFIDQADNFSERADNFNNRTISESDDGRLVAFGGHKWREQRIVVMSILKTFGMGKNWMALRINEEVEAYLNVLAEMKGQPNDVRELTNKAVANVISAIVVGHRFDYKDERFTRLVQILSDKIGASSQSSIIDIFPILQYLPGDIFAAKKVRRLKKELNEYYTYYYIEKFQNELEDTENDNFIKSYLREMKKRKESGMDTGVDIQNLCRVIDALFSAGTDTTSTTIVWAIVYAVNHPKALRKVYDEIREVVGTKRIPILEDRHNMHYLNAFIMETQRLGSLAPLGLPHICTRTSMVEGYIVPKGSLVIPHLDAVLKDEKTWGDPLVFRPERFIDKDGHLFTPNEFVPFSVGRRYCLGETLAKMELFIFLSCLFQRFDIVPEEPNNPPSMEPVLGLTFAPQPFKARLIERME